MPNDRSPEIIYTDSPPPPPPEVSLIFGLAFGALTLALLFVAFGMWMDSPSETLAEQLAKYAAATALAMIPAWLAFLFVRAMFHIVRNLWRQARALWRTIRRTCHSIRNTFSRN